MTVHEVQVSDIWGVPLPRPVAADGAPTSARGLPAGPDRGRWPERGLRTRWAWATIEADEARLREWLAPGATEAEATLAIQSLVGRTLTGEGMSVEAMRVESAQDLAGLRVLAIVWRGTADEPALAQALAQLESARPVLRIDRIALRTIGTEQGVSRLSADIRVGALWAAPPAAPGDAGPSNGAPAAPGESGR